MFHDIILGFMSSETVLRVVSGIRSSEADVFVIVNPFMQDDALSRVVRVREGSVTGVH